MLLKKVLISVFEKFRLKIWWVIGVIKVWNLEPFEVKRAQLRVLLRILRKIRKIYLKMKHFTWTLRKKYYRGQMRSLPVEDYEIEQILILKFLGWKNNLKIWGPQCRSTKHRISLDGLPRKPLVIRTQFSAWFGKRNRSYLDKNSTHSLLQFI